MPTITSGGPRHDENSNRPTWGEVRRRFLRGANTPTARARLAEEEARRQTREQLQDLEK